MGTLVSERRGRQITNATSPESIGCSGLLSAEFTFFAVHPFKSQGELEVRALASRTRLLQALSVGERWSSVEFDVFVVEFPSVMIDNVAMVAQKSILSRLVDAVRVLQAGRWTVFGYSISRRAEFQSSYPAPNFGRKSARHM